MSVARSAELDSAYAACRSIAKREAKNFYYAFRVLPKHKSDAMCAIYAFMRRADDLSDDESISLDERRRAMAAWIEAWRLSRTTASEDAIFVAVNDVQARFGISDTLLEQLVQGTCLDLEPEPEGVLSAELNGQKMQVYESFAALHHYCYLVASVVGLVCIKIFGYSDQRAEELAIDTGVAFQLTNILRDVKEDCDRGRVYLPADLLRENSVSVERIVSLAGGATMQSNELALLNGLEATAQRYYKSAAQLVPLLDAESRPAMWVLIAIYHRLLCRIALDPSSIFAKRVSVPSAQKLAILGVGMMRAAKVRMVG